MGFCLFNNVAITTSFLLNERLELGINKVLIVDWDVHHGNGTQKMFWKDPRVLFFSVHRYEFGSFYPASDDGSHIMVGEGPGAGYNINVPWENARCGDADYFAVWDHVLIPVAKEFSPDMIIISAGFDAAIGDPLGGCRVTPYGYSVMLKKLMEFARGKIVMALEGGYNLDSLANSVLACVEVLLEDKPIAGSSEVYPFESTWRVIKAVREELSAFWPTLADELPKKLPFRKTLPIQAMIFLPDRPYLHSLEETIRGFVAAGPCGDTLPVKHPNDFVTGVGSSSSPSTSVIPPSPVPPSDDAAYWKGFLVCKVNTPFLDAIKEAHPKTFKHFNVETPTIQLLYLNTILGYIKSYSNICISDLDARATREFRRVFRNFCKVGIDISWLEKRFDSCVARHSSISLFNWVKEVSSRRTNVLKEVQAMTAQLVELEQERAKKEGTFLEIEAEERKLMEECRGIEALLGGYK
ncbi:hypothetical protein F0562_024830 [Nyssa sinensis]|uniref:Histone deacetylase domain-containing protein n=1 Tax=Nyssa sinensis TaxID=561372 RepID=A0A5J5BGR1_9ASTE|nr:hypothetical protein F0562_024830 [Nyssa sinensis]